MTPNYRVTAYFALVAALAVPIWVLGAIFNVDLLPGLPLSAIAVICPTLAAGLLVASDGGRTRLFQLLRDALNTRDAHRWLVMALVTNPILFGAAFATSRLLGQDIPAPQISAANALALFALFMPTALLEEIGWSGYALVGLQQRFRPILAALLLGAFWALWHVPALLQAERSTAWIAYWCLWTVSARVIMVWLFNWSKGNLFAVALYHAMSNLCWQLYPIDGTHFDPGISGPITLCAALGLAMTHQMRGRRSLHCT